MSKYASLPDIVRFSLTYAHSQQPQLTDFARPQDTGADVFETPDIPEEHTYSVRRAVLIQGSSHTV